MSLEDVRGHLKEMSTVEYLKKDAHDYSVKRKFHYTKKQKKKVSTEDLRKEIEVARLLGEMQGAERVISTIIANPDYTREDIEAELHIFVKNCGNAAYEVMGSETRFTLYDVLDAHHY